MAAAVKKTTGLTGLAVAKEPRQTLLVLYHKIFSKLKTLPETYPYRKYTEELITQRNNIVKNNQDVAAIEEKINCGQVEELIAQARNEVRLLREMAVRRPWEPLVQKPLPNQWTWPPH